MEQNMYSFKETVKLKEELTEISRYHPESREGVSMLRLQLWHSWGGEGGAIPGLPQLHAQKTETAQHLATSLYSGCFVAQLMHE